MTVTRLVGLFALGLLLLLSAAARVQGQNAQTRDGFWISGGLGYGLLGCDGCTDREGGVSGGLSLGGTISPRLLLGAGMSGWSKSEQGTTLSVGLVDARVRFYPSTTGGFFLTGGAGVGSVHGEATWFGERTETGFGLILGLGYDFRVGRNTSITPYWNGYAMRNPNIDANVGQLGLAITLH